MQVVLVIRSVYDGLAVPEDYFGTASIESSSLVHIIQDVLLQVHLKLKCCHGQRYDGASSMTRIRSGIIKQLTNEEPLAVFTPNAVWSCSKD